MLFGSSDPEFMSDDSETGTRKLHRFRVGTGRYALRNSSIAAMDPGTSAASGDRTGQEGMPIELATFRIFFNRQAAATPEWTADREKGDSCRPGRYRYAILPRPRFGSVPERARGPRRGVPSVCRHAIGIPLIPTGRFRVSGFSGTPLSVSTNVSARRIR
jgi:hypothetical protein